MHSVERKLSNDILPYVVSAHQLRSIPLYRAHALYAYTHDFLAALVGFGVANPLVGQLSGSGGDLAMNLTQAGFSVPLGVGATVLWAALKVTVTRGDGEKRATLAQSCIRELRRLEAHIPRELAKAEPLPGLGGLQAEIESIVDRHIAEESWPWAGPIVTPWTQAQVARRLKQYVDTYSQGWVPDPAVQQRVV